MDSEGHMGTTGNARHIMAYPGNLTESIREIGDVLTTSLGKRNLMTSLKLTASSRRNVCKCHVIWLILVSCCFTKQMISRPGCKAFEYVKKNGLSRFLQKSQTQHRPRPPESGIRNPPDGPDIGWKLTSKKPAITSHPWHQGAPSLWEPARSGADALEGLPLSSPRCCRSLWPTSCHLAFKRFSVWRTQWAVTIPDCNMINMIIIWHNMVI